MAILKLVSDQIPRQIAAQVLWQRKATGEFTEKLLDTALANANLSSADRRLCQELVYGIVRWQAALDWLIDRKTGGRGDRVPLYLGLYQIFWLDKIPPHAAVNETIEAVRNFTGRSGFINAVLRGCLREFETNKKMLDELKAKQPAIGWSHPEWLVARWQERFGAKKLAQLLKWNNTPPKNYARVNTLKTDAGKLAEKWGSEDVDYDVSRHDWLIKNPAFTIFGLVSYPRLTSLESFQHGWFYVQDPSTLLAPLLLGALPGETILDFCAAPGGKTTFLAQLMHNRGRIVAQDVSEERLRLIQENCARLGVKCVETALPSTLKPQLSTTFDRVLVDAPCSNTGVMRRRVDLRWRIQAKEIRRLHDTQLDLLQQAATRVKPGGVLVYSTCSLEPEENQEVVKQFLSEHTGFKLDAERELLPFVDQVDGAYVARLKRP